MIWAKNYQLHGPVDNTAVAFPVTWGQRTTRERVNLAIAMVLLLTVVAVGAGFLFAKGFRLSALDDYRTGYAIGSVGFPSGQRVDGCRDAMEKLYNPQDEKPGWGEFLVGCADGAAGDPGVPWYGLRDRLWGVNGLD